ncbi:NUMOD4 motif-containing HNH endonuclease [Marinilongibacter aquaticus]|uniref:NUMOD4 motif-containing HNH endonuclease n=1 Tax=Marinilongibacter aquaticus TaxID=2975157 RepID=UPI0021BDAC59|nr:NUMOD4 motif-containing HNH endonuclease [Marinilongibacter aquaticus]UBM60676.1 NUMOD4 motif-containing HNH endonuclease [Marinilongibacter aquaticus]
MLHNLEIEKWHRIAIDGVENPPHYEVSSYGRLKSFQNYADGKLLKGSVIQGYRSLNIRLANGKSFNRYIHKLVAEYFVEKKSDQHMFVIHKDYDKYNNVHDNLEWVTQAEMIEHNRTNPNVLNKPRPKKSKNYKLNESKVKIIKKMLKSDTTRLKMIAKQFGITHTQLNRIRSGENWGYVTIEE